MKDREGGEERREKAVYIYISEYIYLFHKIVLVNNK